MAVHSLLDVVPDTAVGSRTAAAVQTAAAHTVDVEVGIAAHYIAVAVVVVAADTVHTHSHSDC